MLTLTIEISLASYAHWYRLIVSSSEDAADVSERMNGTSACVSSLRIVSALGIPRATAT